MNRKVFITVAVWGKTYIDTFVRYNLGTQLAQGNIPSLATFCDVTYQIVTTREDKARLEKTPLFNKLEQLCTIDWQILDELFPQGAQHDNKYYFLSALQNVAMHSAIGHDFLIFNYADFVWADGSMRNLIQRFDDATDAILSFCLPVDLKSGGAALRSHADTSTQGSGVITLAPREATALALDHMHREARLRYWTNKKFTSNPSYVLWQVGNEGAIITAYHQTILALRIDPKNITYYNGITTSSLDGFYTGVVAAHSRAIYADDSDDIFVLSLHDALTNTGLNGTDKTRETLKTNAMRRMLTTGVSLKQRQMALAPIKVRRTYNDARLWREAERHAITTLETLHRETSFDQTSGSNMYSDPAPASNLATTGFLRDLLMRPMVLGTLRFIRKLVITTFVPANIVYNSNFNRWRSQASRQKGTAWENLPARGWIGHFNEGTDGIFARSTEAPNTSARYSLSISGGKGTKTARIAQMLCSFAFLHIRRTGAFTCSGYIRLEGQTNSSITVNLLLPYRWNDFNSCKKRITIGHITVNKPNSWQHFEFTYNAIGALARGALLCFEIDNLASEHDRVYFSQINIEAGFTASAFQTIPTWKEMVLRPLHYFFDRFRRQYISSINMAPTQSAYAPQWVELLYFEQIEELVKNMPTRILPIRCGEHTVLDADSTIYYEIGIMPEYLMKAVAHADHLVQMLESAEKALRHLVSTCPLFIDGQRALGRNLWLQSRPKEALQQFQEAERQRLKLIDMLKLKVDAAVLLPSNCAHVIGLMGHLDAFIKRKQLTDDARPYHLVVPKDQIVNPVFFEYWKPHLEPKLPMIAGTDPASITMAYTTDWNWAIPQDAFNINHVQTAIARVHRQWDAEARPPLLSLKHEHHAVLNQWKKAHGMKENDWFVCLHVRSSGFYNDTTTQDFRNSPIKDYYMAIQAIVDAGGWVIRMGDPSAPKIQGIDMHRVVDYAHSAERSAVLDVALCASCELFVSSLSGLHTVAHAFGRRACYVNIPILAGFPWHPGEIFTPKLYYLPAEHRFLSLEEILSSNLVHADHQHQLARAGVSLLRNTPDDIAQTVIEALQGKNFSMPNQQSGEAVRDTFNTQSQHYQRDISGQLGLYFANKYSGILFPKHSTISQKEPDDGKAPRYRYSQL